MTTFKAKYLAKKFNLTGKNDIEEALVDMYADQITDLLNECNELVRAKFASDKEREKRSQERLEVAWPKNLGFFEKRLKDNKSGFLVGSGLTWADSHLYAVLDWLFERKSEVIQNFPLVKSLADRIEAMPNIAKWLAERPKSAL